jgi:carboxylesterase type B
MRVFILSLLLVTQISSLPHPNLPQATNVYGKDVTYRGLYANEVEGFIGIRYAHDTGGESRFRPPRPYVPDAGSTIRVTTPGPSCPQRISHGAPSPWNQYDYVNHICKYLPCIRGLMYAYFWTAEDCLKLNVWRPNGTTAGDKLAVLVYIHGGALIDGLSLSSKRLTWL